MADLDYIQTYINYEKKAIDTWKILIIDDEPSVHDITSIILKSFRFKNKSLTLLHAFSTNEAKLILKQNENIALILLDIILETKTAGLELIHWIRKELKNNISQIVIRTGDPEHFSEQNTIEEYDVNDYILKTDVTSQRLITLVSGSIRSFIDKFKLQNELIIRKQFELSLKEKETLLKDIVTNIGDILWEVNIKVNYIYISRKAEELTGYSKTTIKNKHFTFSMTSESKNNGWLGIQNAIKRENKFSNIEITRKAKNGSIQYYLCSGNPVYDKSNHFIGYRGADINITNLKNSEIEKEKLLFQLRHAQRLEAIGTLAGGIAHDFNNILGGILGYAQLLQFELKKNETCLGFTKQIVTGCNRAKNLIFQILDFSRQSKNISPQRITNPIEIINETLKLLRASFPSSIKIHSEIDKNIGCIKADPSQIHQSIMNLCTNARQAIEDDMGTIQIKVKEIGYSDNEAIDNLKTDLPFGDYIQISVEDSGKGIELDTLEKIFNPYFTTKNRGDGTGLGLSVVHGIVTRFNGAITIKSQPGEGTIFTLYFPKHIKKRERGKNLPLTPINGEACVLFIDDEPVLVELGKMMLEKLGYKVVTANSPKTALKIFKKDPKKFDIVITDMTMPEMHGTQLAIELKKLNKDLPIILATGFSNLAQSKKAMPSVIDAVLPKPIEINTLSQTLYNSLIQ